VIAAEPLRESAQVALVRICLEEGNIAEAHRHYDRYAAALWNELRLEPSRSFAARLGRAPAGGAGLR
jgi:DNA-binding SARP family transcriptional activator